jgi:hypothetical protein
VRLKCLINPAVPSRTKDIVQQKRMPPEKGRQNLRCTHTVQRAETAERLTNIEAELKDIHARLDQLEQEARNFSGYAKEIDHLLTRVAAIEKHLGLRQQSKA